jgi:hypothetical protein
MCLLLLQEINFEISGIINKFKVLMLKSQYNKPMKKLAFAFAIMLFCLSCRKEEPITTYQIFNSSNKVYTNIEYLDGSMYEVIVYHYNRTSIVRQDTIDEILTNGGNTELYEVPENADLFRVSFKFLPSKSPLYNSTWNTRFYLTDYKIITRGDNNIFGINGGSYISDKISKSQNHVPF